MKHAFLVICAIVFAGFWITNAGVMLASPKLWFRAPLFNGTRGVMTEQKYGDGWGRIKVRILGAVFLGAALWIIYDIASN